MGRAGAVVLLLLAAVAEAHAQPCDALVDAGPLMSAPGPADLGQIPEACPGRELSLRLRGELLANPADFYGVITVGSTLRARWSFRQRWYVSAALDPVTWRMPINAVVSSSGAGFGPATLGLHRQFAWTRTSLTPYVRWLVPIDTARRYGARHGAELGVAAARRIRERWSVRGGLGLPATLVVIEGTGHGAFHTSALAEAAFAPRPWIAVSAGLASRVQVAPRTDLNALAARAGVRMMAPGGWHFGLGLDLPFAGIDRTDLTAALFAAWVPAERR